MLRIPNAPKRSCTALVITTSLLLSAQGVMAAEDGKSIDLCQFKKVFADDFNDLSVSASSNATTRWSAHTPWNGDFGDAQFVNPVTIFADQDKNGPFTVKDGILTITARKQDNGKWTSGLLSSVDATGAGFKQLYGYFEARMKLPPGPGVWPAFWLNSYGPKGDTSPGLEVDQLEYYGQFPDGFHSGWHLWMGNSGQKDQGSETITKVPSGSLSEAFHTYGVDVEKDFITYYFDGKEIFKVNTPAEHKKPLMILVNLALGSGWPIDKTINPSRLEVDYVYAYRRVDTPSESDCSKQERK